MSFQRVKALLFLPLTLVVLCLSWAPMPLPYWGVPSVLAKSNKQGTLAYAPNSEKMDGVEALISRDLSLYTIEDLQGDEGEGRDKKVTGQESDLSFETPVKRWKPSKSFNIPLTRNEQVDRWIVYFTKTIRPQFTQWLRRAGSYAPLMEEILREYDLPTDLIYLSMVESGFKTKAYSRAHAAGLWQFIRSTGRLYGLEPGRLVDERRDYLKSTRAAASHLRDLYRHYNDWYLAFAAYNAGSGKVNRAIRRMGTKNFWKLASRRSHHLRQETKDYVPKILAAAIVTKNYTDYGFSSRLFDQPLSFTVATVPDATDVEVIARCSGVSVKEIEFLNPSLLLGVTPPGKRFTIQIPSKTEKRFKRNYKKVALNQRTRFTFYKPRRGENLLQISKNFKVSRGELAKINRLSAKSTIGDTYVLIPKKNVPFLPTFEPGEGLEEVQTSVATRDLEGSGDGLGEIPAVETYRVKRGDTLSLIARDNGVSMASLRSMNGLGKSSLIRTGQILRLKAPEVTEKIASSNALTSEGSQDQENSSHVLPVDVKPSPIVHRVQHGETLWHLSKRYNVSIRQIKMWNALKGNSIYPNQKIKIQASLSKPPHLSYLDIIKMRKVALFAYQDSLNTG